MPSPVSNFPIWTRPLRQFMRPLVTSARGMSVQQRFLEVISANLANAETTRTPEGGPYRRQIASVSGDVSNGGGTAAVQSDTRPGRSVYDPGHPDADANGFVNYPNVDVTTELVDMMVARRVFEANATVFQSAKAMLRRALDI